MFLGTFLACLSILFFEILATRVLGIVQGPDAVYYTVAVAMLGMGAAGSLVSVFRWRPDPPRACRAAAVLSGLTSLSILAVFVVAVAFKDLLNAGEDQSLGKGGLAGLVDFLVGSQSLDAVRLGAVLALPYFFMGCVLSLLFVACPDAQRHRLYGIDLLGAALGCILAIVLLETTGFGVPLGVAIATPLFAAGAYRRGAGGRGWWWVGLGAVALVAFAIPDVHVRFEPKPYLRRLARVHREPLDTSVREVWHGWNSYARVAALEIRRGPSAPPEYVMALGVGEGHATVRPYRGPRPPAAEPDAPTELALAACDPHRVLVLFAGAGRDMIALDERLEGKASIVGVELLQDVVAWPKADARFRLKEFFDLPHINYVISEAREHLERDLGTYDAILIAWSGASVSYYTGAGGHAARYVYTKEGLESLLRHLTPGGQLTILNTNKVKIIAALRTLFEEAGRNDLARCIVLMDKPGGEDANWWDPWDENRLLVKPSGFTPEDLVRVREVAKRFDLRVRTAPDLPPDPQDPYGRVLHTSDLHGTLQDLADSENMDIHVHTDDRPFLLDIFPAKAYFRSDFWSGEFALTHDDGSPQRQQWRLRRAHLKNLGWFALVSVVLVLGPLFLRRKTRARGIKKGNHLLFFALLGAGFMFVEMGFIQKLGLFLGHPGHAIAVVLASLILFTGVGSLASGVCFRRRWLGFRSAAFLSAGTTLALFLGAEALAPKILPLSLPIKMLLVFLGLGPAGFFLGQLFPQGLERLTRTDASMVPWALAVNAAAGTLAAGFGVIVAQTFGFRAVVLAGVGLYVLVGFLPHGVRAASPSERTEPKVSEAVGTS